MVAVGAHNPVRGGSNPSTPSNNIFIYVGPLSVIMIYLCRGNLIGRIVVFDTKNVGSIPALWKLPIFLRLELTVKKSIFVSSQ